MTTELDKDVLLAEYHVLRDELAVHQQQIYRLYQLSMTGSVIVLAWGITQRNWLITLTPTPIIVVSILLMLGEMESMFRIAAYIETFIERRLPDLNWESRLRLVGNRRGLAEQYQNSALAVAYLLIAGTSLAMAWVTAGNRNPITADAARGFIAGVIVFCVAVAVAGVYFIYRNRELPTEAHRKLWIERSDEEAGLESDPSPAPVIAPELAEAEAL